jgi:endo-1,4-beta-xylanase
MATIGGYVGGYRILKTYIGTTLIHDFTEEGIPEPVPIPAKLVSPNLGTARMLPIAWGTAVKDDMFTSVPYGSILINEYDTLTPENAGKMAHIMHDLTSFDFSDMDRLMDFALANGKQVHWHTPVYPAASPGWFNDAITAAATPAAAMAIIYNFIDKFIERYNTPKYAGIIVGVDVVNEPFESNGTHKATALYAKVPNYIALSVKRINDKAPNWLTFINDYGQEYGSTNKLQALINQKAACAAVNARLDGIGIQLHTVARIGVGVLADRMKMVTDAGLMVHISEADMLLHNGIDNTNQGDYPFLTPTLDAQAAQVWLNILNAYLALPEWSRYAFRTWSLGDSDNYINSQGQGGPQDYPGLRYLNWLPKPSLLKIASRAAELRNFAIYDNYRAGTRANLVGSFTGGTSPKAYSVVGSGSPYGALWVTDKGLQAKTFNTGVYSFGIVDAGTPNYTMMYGISDLLSGSAPNSNKQCRGVFRFLDYNNYWFFGPTNNASVATWILGKKIANSDTILYSSPVIANPNDVPAIVCSGNTISVYVNGVLLFTATDAKFNDQTKLGFKFRGNVDTVSAVEFLAVGI